MLSHPLIVFLRGDQITGDQNVASSALLQITMRLRANTFEMEGATVSLPHAVPYLPMAADISEGSKYGNRENKSRGRGYSSSRYDSSDYPPSDGYGSYGSSQVI